MKSIYSKLFFGVKIFIALALFSCSKPAKDKGNYLLNCPSQTIECLDGLQKVEMITSKGKIIFELDGDSAPLTSGNFLDLINRGVYNNTIFHRVVKDPFPFVIQGGDPLSKDIRKNKNIIGTGKFINKENGKIRQIPLEIKLNNEKYPRYNYLIKGQDNFSQITLTHKKGSLAMARSQALDSASAQFYISLRELPELDGRYAVFGRVIEGIDVLNIMQKDDRILSIKKLTN